jgi:hypothetical protein
MAGQRLSKRICIEPDVGHVRTHPAGGCRAFPSTTGSCPTGWTYPPTSRMCTETPFCARASDDALRLFGRALNRYAATGDNCLWIITEADRSATTFRLPDEY